MASSKDQCQGCFDAATSLFIQCRTAHLELQRVALHEGRLLNRLHDELQRLRSDNDLDEILKVDVNAPIPAELKMVLDEDGSPTFHDQEGQPLPRRPSVRSMHSTQSRMSGTRLQRAKSGISAFSLEGNDMSPSASYTINGFNQKEEAKVPRNSLMKMVKSNTLQFLGGSGFSQRLQRLEDLVERCWKLEEPERTGCLARVVRSNVFGLFCGAVILVNALFILNATDYEMQNLAKPIPADMQIVELLLASFYILELALKLIVHRWFFFWNSEMAWNWFDFCLVLFSIIENLLVFDVFGTSGHEAAGSGVNLGFFRLVRLCRVVKVLRVLRTVRFFSELRLMLDCVVGSLMNVIWCFIMLLFVVYIFALLLQQGVVEYLTEKGPDISPAEGTGLHTYFRSVGTTVLTLFQSCTGGTDWREPYEALVPTGWLLPSAFVLYVAFVFISVWNIVTSCFVEKALKLAQPDVDMLILEQQLQDFKDCHMLAGLFQKMLHKADADATASASSASDLEGRERSNDRIGLEDFQRLVGTYEFRSYLQTRGIDIKNAETFFKMLVELQGEETIDAATFANACVRMKGAATSIDLQTVMFTTHVMNEAQRVAFENVLTRLVRIESVLLPDELEHLDIDSSTEECGPIEERV